MEDDVGGLHVEIDGCSWDGNNFLTCDRMNRNMEHKN